MIPHINSKSKRLYWVSQDKIENFHEAYGQTGWNMIYFPRRKMCVVFFQQASRLGSQTPTCFARRLLRSTLKPLWSNLDRGTKFSTSPSRENLSARPEWRARFYNGCDAQFFVYTMHFLESIGYLKRISNGVTIKHLTQNILIHIFHFYCLRSLNNIASWQQSNSIFLRLKKSQKTFHKHSHSLMAESGCFFITKSQFYRPTLAVRLRCGANKFSLSQCSHVP